MSKEVTDKALKKLLEFYKNAKANVMGKINDAYCKGSNEFYLRQALTQIEKELDKLYQQNCTWIKEQSALAFCRGYNQFSKEIGKAASVKGAVNFVKMNNTAVEMLSQSAANNIGDALRQIKVNSKNVINKIGRRENDIIADVGIRSSAEALAEISPSSAREKIIGRLAEKEIFSVTYKNGVKVPVDVYASMVARTTTHEAAATSKLIAAEQDGYDLVKMSTHYPTCKTCAQLQGRVYSISGNDKRFPALSVAFKQGYNIVHPNCRHVVNVWVEEMKTDEEVSNAVKVSSKSFDIDPRSEKERELYAAQQKLRKNSVDKSGGSGIIKNIKLSDIEKEISSGKIHSDVGKTIFDVLSETNSQYLFDDVTVVKLDYGIVMQTEPVRKGTFFDIRLNLNENFFGGKTIEQIDEQLRNSAFTVANTFRDAVIHEKYHANLINGLNYSQLESLYDELSEIHIKGVSKTAYKDGSECIAEVGVLLERGDISNISQEAKDLFNKYLGGIE